MDNHFLLVSFDRCERVKINREERDKKKKDEFILMIESLCSLGLSVVEQTYIERRGVKPNDVCNQRENEQEKEIQLKRNQGKDHLEVQMSIITV